MMAKNADQIALAKAIGAEFCGTALLKPLGAHSHFAVPPLPLDPVMWGDERLCHVAWVAVAALLRARAPEQHIIDHAWLAGHASQPYEAWAFITEPYIDEQQARDIAAGLNDEISACFGVTWHALPAARSAWNPGNCVPIVATLDRGGFPLLLKHGLAHAFGWIIQP